jgi:hypothetical protein
MNRSVAHSSNLRQKAEELGLPEETLVCALDMILVNRHLLNALDHTGEMDDYIYQALLRQSIARRKQRAEDLLSSAHEPERILAEKELAVLSREELTTEPYYRAVLPLIVKVVGHETILRCYAEEASALVQSLADFKRRHRSISFTEIIVRHCSAEIRQELPAA